MSSDYIADALAADGMVRIYAASTTNMVEEARKIHNTSPVVTAALGRLLTAGVMMGGMMKNDTDVLTLQIRSDGPVGGLTVTARNNGTARGYAIHPDVDLPPKRPGKLDVGGAVGHGQLSVIRDLGMDEPYVGQVDLVSGEIAEDLTYYYAVSEQVNSCVALGVLVDTDCTVRRAGGFILQLMPFATDELIDSLEKTLGSLPAITSMLDEGMTPEQIIKRVMEGYDVKFYGTMPAAYRCECSRERVERALISIGKKDLQEMIDDGKPIDVGCQFCQKHYSFTPDELRVMLGKASS